NFFLFARGTLSYLDTYALPLVLLGAWALTGSRGRPRRAFLSGLSLGLALLITQKAVLALLPPLAFFLCPGPNQRTPGASGRRPGAALAAWGLGGLAAALVLPLLLGPSGTAGFVHDALVLNLH